MPARSKILRSFWASEASRIDWIKPFTRVKDTSFGPGSVSIKWFADGTTNVAQNCIDRHLLRLKNHTAIIWEGDDPKDSKHITYQELYDEVCRLANVLKAHGVKKGDTVTIYLPMIPEAAYAMLACARIGAIHSVVFAGFSPDSLAGRIEDCRSKLLITADEGLRGGRKTQLKAHADEAVAKTGGIVKTMLVVRHTGGAVAWVDGRDVWYHEATSNAAAECPCAEMNAEDPLFILYTSGSTGTPKGRRAHDGRLSRLCRDDASLCFRLSRRRHLLVHRRRRLGDRAQLYRLWPARQWRHDAHVRGHPDLSERVALLGGRRQASASIFFTPRRPRSAR